MIGHVRPEEMSGWRCLVELSSLKSIGAPTDKSLRVCLSVIRWGPMCKVFSSACTDCALRSRKGVAG